MAPQADKSYNYKIAPSFGALDQIEYLMLSLHALRYASFFFQVKKSSAMEEKAWKGCGTRVGLKIWRIEKFKASIV